MSVFCNQYSFADKSYFSVSGDDLMAIRPTSSPLTLDSQETLTEATTPIRRVWVLLTSCNAFLVNRLYPPVFADHLSLRHCHERYLYKMRSEPSCSPKVKPLTVHATQSPALKHQAAELQGTLDEWTAISCKVMEMRFVDSYMLTVNVSRRIISGLKGDQVFLARDSEGKLQGVAIGRTTGSGDFELEAVVTAPWNIRHEINDGDPRKHEGVGTALFERAVRECYTQRGCSRLIVMASDSAAPFYERLGMKKFVTSLSSTQKHFELTREGMAIFLEKHGGRALS